MNTVQIGDVDTSTQIDSNHHINDTRKTYRHRTRWALHRTTHCGWALKRKLTWCLGPDSLSHTPEHAYQRSTHPLHQSPQTRTWPWYDTETGQENPLQSDPSSKDECLVSCRMKKPLEWSHDLLQSCPV